MSDLPIVDEEEKLLARVHASVASAAKANTDTPPAPKPRYDKQLIELRDEIAESRLEDVPALVAQMERLSGVAARRAEVQVVPVDPGAPYFAHLRLKENGKERDILIGRTTHIDSRSGVRIVDWRHAPVSQIYYRYPEGSSYEESFGGREVEGEVLIRRTVTVNDARLVRIQAPQGVFVRPYSGDGPWKHLDPKVTELSGGQGTAARPDRRGVLGVGPDGEQRLDRHLPEIAALLDPRQFELISAPDSGVVVIQGGAGSGKTTIGLHRMAYLAFRDPPRFQPSQMLVITYGVALGAYISEVLPALGVDGVRVETFAAWAASARRSAYPWLHAPVEEDTPTVVTRLKKHPALLKLFARRVKEHIQSPRAARNSRAALTVWGETLTDLSALREALDAYGEGNMSDRDLAMAHRWCTERCVALLELENRETSESTDDGEPAPPIPPPSSRRPKDDGDDGPIAEEGDDDQSSSATGIDGRSEEDELATLDLEDDALLLRIHQLLVGPLRKGKQPLAYSHLFVDEAQDLSPVELAVLMDTTSGARSVTLAGDTAQKLYIDNGFRDWRATLSDLGMSSTEIEPLRIAYRSTKQVMSFAREVLGPLADPDPPDAPRSGAAVEVHQFPQTGAAVAFVADALRPLIAREPRATVGVLTRFAEQADAYYEGLKRSEIGGLRRVRAQEFSFKPGIDVTDIRQVKGLEFDYVILCDVNSSVFPADDQARHLLHIAATRAAHQLWIVVSGTPSPLLPASLLER